MNAKTLLQGTSMFQRLMLFMLLLALLIVLGCENTPSEVSDYNPEPVLTAFIENGIPVEEVIVERVGRFYNYYDATQQGISDVRVTLYPVLDADGSPADTAGRVCYFEEDATRDGHYIPTSPYIPQPFVRYRVTADHDGEKVHMSAETTVPDTLSIEVYQHGLPVDVEGDTMRITDSELYFRWSDSEACGGYQLGILALNDREDLVPLDPEYDPTDEDEVEMYEKTPSYGYTIAPDYQNSIFLTWLYFTWAGPTRIDVTACSKEYYEYVFTTLSLNENEYLPLTNVTGGIGIFGAVSQQTVTFVMEIVE